MQQTGLLQDRRRTAPGLEPAVLAGLAGPAVLKANDPCGTRTKQPCAADRALPRRREPIGLDSERAPRTRWSLRGSRCDLQGCLSRHAGAQLADLHPPRSGNIVDGEAGGQSDRAILGPV